MERINNEIDGVVLIPLKGPETKEETLKKLNRPYYVFTIIFILGLLLGFCFTRLYDIWLG